MPASSELALCFIPDGFHLPEALIRLIVSCRPIEKLVVVSDAANFAGVAPGRYTANSGAEVDLSSEGRSCLASDPQIAGGSSSNIIKGMNYFSSDRQRQGRLRQGAEPVQASCMILGKVSPFAHHKDKTTGVSADGSDCKEGTERPRSVSLQLTECTW